MLKKKKKRRRRRRMKVLVQMDGILCRKGALLLVCRYCYFLVKPQSSE
jgi:hypothetical protein